MTLKKKWYRGTISNERGYFMQPLTKEQMCLVLSELYGWKYDELMKRNESQLYTLYSACQDENGKLRTAEQPKK